MQRNGITLQSNRQAFLDLAKAGIQVFPFRLVKRKGKWEKVPYINDWQNRATTDNATTDRQSVEWPDAMAGIPKFRARALP